MLINFFCDARTIRVIGWLFLALATTAIPLARGSAADAGMLHLRCTNPVNGANWVLAVDFDRGTVDSLPATISDGWIKWHDKGGGIYELERATGKLRLRIASSTGGYFVHYTCSPE